MRVVGTPAALLRLTPAALLRLTLAALLRLTPVVPAIAAAALLNVPAVAHAQLGTAPCADQGFLCGELDVPLDRSGAVPGMVRLRLMRLPAAAAPTQEALVALAGGPGQAALPIAPSFAESLTPLRRARDLVVFDQRGTGGSGPLRCTVPQWSRTTAGVGACARQLGSARGSYRTIDSVQDIEALRVAGGYQRLVIYGVSYGTKVALTYAARYPDRVAALVLDSVVPADGPDPFARAAFGAAGRVLRELCAGGACTAATSDVTLDLRRAVRQLQRRPLRGFVTSQRGTRLVVELDAPGLWGILLAGDLNPALRAELPGALRAMLRRDRAPILRLLARADGLTEGSGPAISETLFAATRCEETPFPWDRAADAGSRLAQARAAGGRLPTAPFAPFGRSVALSAGLFDLCARWPVASPAPEPIGPLPNVPTLVLSGAADLRTSAEQARAAVAAIPGARIAIVAGSGHSVLGSDLGDCAAREVEAFATGATPTCTPAANIFQPTPKPPPNLGELGGRTKAQRTIKAVLATLDDVRRQLIGDAIAAQRGVTSGSRTAGLRGGFAVVAGSVATLSSVSYVPGVTVTGSYPFRGDGSTRVTVGGPRAARGELTIDPSDHVTGTLDGEAVSFNGSASAATLRRESRWPEPAFPHLALRSP